MKKNYCKRRWTLADPFSKAKLSCCVSAFLLLICFCQPPQVHARDSSGNAVISFSVDHEPIRNVFNLVEQQTGLTFFYLDNQVDVDRPVTLTVSNLTLEKALSLLFANTSVTYRITGSQIVLKKAGKKGKVGINKSPTGQIDGLTAETLSRRNLIISSPATITVSGVVTSDTGESLPGVNVMEKGTTNGTTTNVDGEYSLSLTDESSVLIFSFIGFVPQEVVVGNRSILDVQLETDIKSLEEVVVIGYGTQEKRALTGSVSSISAQEITQNQTFNFMDGMQGRATGISVQSSSGTPGAPTNIRIRGINSINSGTDPLWVIDGMPVFSDPRGRSANTVPQNPMASINPNDIESIEVLKDAAATAIYGSRGSNGVIIVTTKSGKGKGDLSVNYSTGISQLSKTVEDAGLANTQEWIAIVDQARANGGLSEFDPSNTLNANYTTPITREEALATQSDWAKQGLRDGSFNDVDVSFSMGNEKLNVFSSLNYRKDKGINVGNDLTRLSGRTNLELNPVNRLKLGTRLNFTYLENYRTKESSSNPGQNAGSVGSFAGIVKAALPWYPIYNEDDPSGYWNPQAGNIALANRRDLILDKREQYRALGTVYAEYEIPGVQGLSLRGEGSFDILQDNATNWVSPVVMNNGKSFVYEASDFAQSVNYNALLKYNRSFNDIHYLGIVAGTESQSTYSYLKAIEGTDLVGYNQELGSSNPGTINSVVGSRNEERYLRSFFTRADYRLNNRYLLGASIRRDGSSRFASDYRWGTFYALSGGWIISEEQFFSSLTNVVSFMKLRASYGETGNQSIPANQNITTLRNSSSNR